MTRAAFLKREATEYMKSQDMTPQERQDLLAWVKEGESVRSNPWLMCDEQGNPMDYLSAMRAADELRTQHEAKSKLEFIEDSIREPDEEPF
jgi:hypothetical protein